MSWFRRPHLRDRRGYPRRRYGSLRYRRRRAAGWAGLAILVLLSAGAWLWVLSTPPATDLTGDAGPSSAARARAGATGQDGRDTQGARRHVRDPGTVPLGVYTGPGGRGAAAAVDAKLGGHVEYALDFLAATSWTTITQPEWLATVWQGSGFRMVLGVPMLPSTGATLAEGASGAFDGEFSLLASRLVSDGFGTSVLMIGWQPDDRGEPWYVASEATARAYVRYWDRIQAVMSAVPGAHFVYEWDGGDGRTSPVSPAAMYPGNAAVDVVATDAFDRLSTGEQVATRWESVLDEPWGPAWAASFAAAHRKPMAVAMWGELPTGQGGGGDDPRFVRGLLTWASTDGVQMCVLWDYGSWVLTSRSYPAAVAALAATVDRPAG